MTRRAVLFASLFFFLATPTLLSAQEKTTIGGACTSGRNATDWDTIMNCSNSVWKRAPLFLGAATTSAGAAVACSAATAGLLQWSSGSFQICNGTSWTTLSLN